MQQSPVRRYILNNLTQHQKDIVRAAVRKFGLSRQAVLRHMKVLILDGRVEAHGKTRDRYYVLKPLVNKLFEFQITPDLSEDVVGRNHIYPHLKNFSENVREICEYGFSQIMNNVIAHSGGKECKIRLLINDQSISMRIRDDGRKGIFSRVASHYGLDDPRCAALELSKGKVSTDLKHHTGEGIFFAMRLFDRATIRSNGLLLRHTLSGGEWILEDSNDRIRGTTVSFRISRRAIQTLRGVMNDFSTNGNGLLLFDRTEVPVRLASIDSESLMSRSQARRLLRGLEQFHEVALDFKAISSIGQPFADELFRVFPGENNKVRIVPNNTSPDVKVMIQRASNGEGIHETQPNGTTSGK